MTEFNAGDKVLVHARYAGSDNTYGIPLDSDAWPFEDTIYCVDFEDEYVLESGWLATAEMLELVAREGADGVEDVVNHPGHYTKFGVEVIDLTEHLSFCAGNAIKYVARAGLKDPSKHIEDLKKAAWYIDREIARIERAGDKEAR